jgi:hypothetical protein
MCSCRQCVVVNGLVGVLVMVTLAEAKAADCGDAIKKAVAEWSEKEPTWAFSEPDAHPGPGKRHFGVLDERTRIAFGRPIAKSLARACGKSDVKVLEDHVADAPHLILLTLDEIGAPGAAAESAVKIIQRTRQYPPPHVVLLWVSLCSPATRAATALALVNMPPQQHAVAPLFSLSVFSFVAAVGDKDTVPSLESAANDPKRASWRPYYVECASFIRWREKLPQKARNIRAKDDLLFWQTREDGTNYQVPRGSYIHPADTLANRRETISTDYLLHELRLDRTQMSHTNCDPSYQPHLDLGSPAELVIYILENQRDPAAIPALEEFAEKNPRLHAEVLRAIETIQGKSHDGNP